MDTPGGQVADPATAAPPGTRVRAGNAMGRTRAAVAAGTAECLARSGARKTTMIDIAKAAGIAKGTLYNHVRTRAEAYLLLAETETDRLVQLIATEPDVTSALTRAGDAVATHPVVRQLAALEPGALAVLALPGEWTDSCHVRLQATVAARLGEPAGMLAFRWLLSLLFSPGDEVGRAREVATLVGTGARPSDAAPGFPA